MKTFKILSTCLQSRVSRKDSSNPCQLSELAVISCFSAKMSLLDNAKTTRQLESVQSAQSEDDSCTSSECSCLDDTKMSGLGLVGKD